MLDMSLRRHQAPCMIQAMDEDTTLTIHKDGHVDIYNPGEGSRWVNKVYYQREYYGHTCTWHLEFVSRTVKR